jgi:hypothetical protein
MIVTDLQSNSVLMQKKRLLPVSKRFFRFNGRFFVLNYYFWDDIANNRQTFDANSEIITIIASVIITVFVYIIHSN